MNPSPQENQPGEAPPTTNLVGISSKLVVGPEPQAECHTPPNVTDGVKRWTVLDVEQRATYERNAMNRVSPELFVLLRDYTAERAKRLELEQEIFEARQAILREGLRSAGIERELAETDDALLTANLKCNEYGVRMDKAEAELLALRGGEGRKVSAAGELSARITQYLCVGGLFNPEMMEHDKVRDLLLDCRELLCVLSEEGGRQKEGRVEPS